MNRKIERLVTLGPVAPGFGGDMHTAVEVIAPNALQASDPFVLLMDDRIDVEQAGEFGGAHPHAGLETVTFVLAGELRDREEGVMRAGDVVWMSAGKGVIHNEHVEMVPGHARVLQLWIRLPSSARSTPPRFEVIRREAALVRHEPGVEVRLYSGSTGALRSPTLNWVPVTLADAAMQPGATLTQALPVSYNGFLLALDGSVTVDGKTLSPGQIGWLDRPAGTGESTLTISAGPAGARVLFYAGEPQHEPLIQHGPFVGGSEQEIIRYFHEFRAGSFTPMSQLTPVR